LASLPPFSSCVLCSEPFTFLGIQEGQDLSITWLQEGRKKNRPQGKKQQRPSGQTNNDLFILTIDDSFSRTPPETRTEMVIHQNTPVTKTV
jgi:hypothetical protein